MLGLGGACGSGPGRACSGRVLVIGYGAKPIFLGANTRYEVSKLKGLEALVRIQWCLWNIKEQSCKKKDLLGFYSYSKLTIRS